MQEFLLIVFFIVILNLFLTSTLNKEKKKLEEALRIVLNDHISDFEIILMDTFAG